MCGPAPDQGTKTTSDYTDCVTHSLPITAIPLCRAPARIAPPPGLKPSQTAPPRHPNRLVHAAPTLGTHIPENRAPTVVGTSPTLLSMCLTGWIRWWLRIIPVALAIVAIIPTLPRAIGNTALRDNTMVWTSHPRRLAIAAQQCAAHRHPGCSDIETAEFIAGP